MPAPSPGQSYRCLFLYGGHPSETLKQAVSGPRKVRFIPITGPGIDRLIAGKKYYAKTVLAGGGILSGRGKHR